MLHIELFQCLINDSWIKIFLRPFYIFLIIMTNHSICKEAVYAADNESRRFYNLCGYWVGG